MVSAVRLTKIGRPFTLHGYPGSHGPSQETHFPAECPYLTPDGRLGDT